MESVLMFIGCLFAGFLAAFIAFAVLKGTWVLICWKLGFRPKILNVDLIKETAESCAKEQLECDAAKVREAGGNPEEQLTDEYRDNVRDNYANAILRYVMQFQSRV